MAELQDLRVQKMDELVDRMDKLPGYEWPFPIDDLWRRLNENDPDGAGTTEMLRTLERDIMRAEAGRDATIQMGMRQVKRFLQVISSEKGEYGIRRNDGQSMGMGEAIHVGNMLEAMENMVKAYGRTE